MFREKEASLLTPYPDVGRCQDLDLDLVATIKQVQLKLPDSLFSPVQL
jgi:hypothetical protein